MNRFTSTDELNAGEIGMLLARRHAACKVRERKRALRKAFRLMLPREMCREVARQIANYRAQWSLLRRETRT